jgi:hypothetical protein
MPTDRIGALQALLAEAEAAHGVFEATELNGVFDEAWTRWYASYAIDHGIGELLGRAVTIDDLAAYFETTWAEAQRADPRPTDPWATWMAPRIAAEL